MMTKLRSMLGFEGVIMVLVCAGLSVFLLAVMLIFAEKLPVNQGRYDITRYEYRR